MNKRKGVGIVWWCRAYRSAPRGPRQMPTHSIILHQASDWGVDIVDCCPMRSVLSSGAVQRRQCQHPLALIRLDPPEWRESLRTRLYSIVLEEVLAFPDDVSESPTPRLPAAAPSVPIPFPSQTSARISGLEQMSTRRGGKADGPQGSCADTMPSRRHETHASLQ